MNLPYQTIIHWSQEDECYVARVPALRGCLAHGATQEEAAREITVAAELWLETAREAGKPIPAPEATLERLASLSPILNLAKVAREAGISRQTIASKLSRGTPFSEVEKEALSAVLAAHGMDSHF